jgi:hypothetical protein
VKQQREQERMIMQDRVQVHREEEEEKETREKAVKDEQERESKVAELRASMALHEARSPPSSSLKPTTCINAPIATTHATYRRLAREQAQVNRRSSSPLLVNAIVMHHVSRTGSAVGREPRQQAQERGGEEDVGRG